MSNYFWLEYRKIEKEKDKNIRQKYLVKLIDEESFRLSSLISSISLQIDGKKLEASDFLSVKNRYNSLTMEFVAANTLYKSLTESAQRKALEANYISEETRLLSKATSPIYPSGPLVEFVLIISIGVSLFISLIVVLVRQSVINKILTVTQAKIIGETDFYAGIDIKKLRVKSLIKGAENLPLSPELY